jgi:hypothetical protein
MQSAKTASSVIKILALSSTDQNRAEICRPKFHYMIEISLYDINARVCGEQIEAE